MTENQINNKTSRYVGTSVYGIRMPIITQGADIANIITDTIIKSAQSDYQPLTFHHRDIIGITESFLARAQGNYIQLKDLSDDVARKFPTGDVAVAFPILSRNRFAKILEGIAKGVQGKVYVCLSYPADEVGNPIMDEDDLFRSTLNPYSDVLTKADFRAQFGTYKHPITGTDYIELYEKISPNIEIVLLNNPKDILSLTNQVLVSSIHARHRHKQILESLGAKVHTLEEICNQPQPDKGWSEYGVLGSNFSDSERLKLFPREATAFCKTVQRLFEEKTGKKVEVMVYGDGGFKCPKTKIWEFADPVVSPGHTDGLMGMPNEIKIKAVADNNVHNAEEAIKSAIANKKQGNDFYSLGTTPRQITDLVGSLCDLTSGSGDKGTPVIYIKGYFDDYTKGTPQA
ncbi:MAG: coenzyme F420-0:L-glutamate ligase [Alphaproteobacteria bacterium]|nr:coenzyme F420-0:L-glutamate ligase [Alphaproteobacteria bacterium]MBR3912988.1 coenzyme F420-0:L-glutamate ligase [Alphaproteobacteria bacterium]